MKEINGWEEFSEYLLELEKQQSEKDFDCPKLIILPEGVKFNYGRGEVEYEQGAPLCHRKAFMRNGISSRCVVDSDMSRDKEGRLEVQCKFGHTIKFNAAGFEPYES